MQRSWESLKEDASGRLKDSSSEQASRLKDSSSRGREGAIRRGMIRYVYLLVDCSEAMEISDSDFRPTRGAAASEVLSQWLSDFFAENPLSQVGVIAIRGGQAEKLTDLSGNKRSHVDAVGRVGSSCSGSGRGGEASLQNALELAIGLLRDIPEYGHRECVVLFGSLATKDPGDVFSTIDKAQRHCIHTSVVGLAAEVQILKALADATGGSFRVATGVEHLRRLMMTFIVPPPTARGTAASLRAEMVEMGFPRREQSATPLLGYQGSALVPLSTAFVCPRCATRAAEVPSICAVCTLPLVSAPHLAQSYHHLFPLPPFEVVCLPAEAVARSSRVAHECAGCGCRGERSSDEGEWYSCPDCKQTYCIECEGFLHEALHNCPGCIDRGGP